MSAIRGGCGCTRAACASSRDPTSRCATCRPRMRTSRANWPNASSRSSAQVASSKAGARSKSATCRMACAWSMRVRTTTPSSTTATSRCAGQADAASALAAHAEERRPLPDRARTDRRAAGAAGLAGAAIDVELLLEVAGQPVGTDEVAQRGAAARDRMREDAPDLECEALVALARHRARRARRMDPRGEQRLARIDVADADDDRLVHQELLDRGLAAARAAPQQFAVEGIRQGFRAETREQRMRGPARLPQLAAETARIGVTQHL